MARKSNVKLILELREAQLSRNYIADRRHFARNSVSDVFRIAEERGITYSDVRSGVFGRTERSFRNWRNMIPV